VYHALLLFGSVSNHFVLLLLINLDLDLDNNRDVVKPLLIGWVLHKDRLVSYLRAYSDVLL